MARFMFLFAAAAAGALFAAPPTRAAPLALATYSGLRAAPTVRRVAIRPRVMLSRAVRRRAAPSRAFDGYWSVLVVTKRGDCDQAYRWGVGVVDGHIANVGGGVAQAAGSISPSGRVDVQFTIGADVLDAKGALGAKWGTGTWVSPTRACSGRWTAEKRAYPGGEAEATP